MYRVTFTSMQHSVLTTHTSIVALKYSSKSLLKILSPCCRFSEHLEGLERMIRKRACMMLCWASAVTDRLP